MCFGRKWGLSGWIQFPGKEDMGGVCERRGFLSCKAHGAQRNEGKDQRKTREKARERRGKRRGDLRRLERT